jgi:tetratricopeptide (TPR) repeat protein
LHLKQEDYQSALKDFTDAININPVKGFAYVGKGTCEKELKKYNEAIETFTKGITTDMGHICV